MRKVFSVVDKTLKARPGLGRSAFINKLRNSKSVLGIVIPILHEVA
jgi:hypothetical protein